MYLLYFPQQNTFVRYDNFRFVGIPEEKKFWHFLKKMPPNLLEILRECGYQVSAPAGDKPFYQEKRRFLRRMTHLTVYDPVQQTNVSGTGKDWVEALNNLTAQLRKANMPAT